MYIAFYISSHGFGHMTRCLSIIDYLLKNTDYNLYIACDKSQNDFARIYLKDYKDRIIYKDIKTDIGLINKKNSLEVDKDLLEIKLNEFIQTWDNLVEDEVNSLRSLNIKKIICDISPIGCLVGDKLNIETILISNFTWIDQYKYLGIDESIIDKFKKAYSYINKLIKYDLCLPMVGIECENTDKVGFVCREIDENKVSDLKLKYGESIFITCGKSANLNSINVKNFNRTIFTTQGIQIKSSEGASIVELPLDIKDTQNYIAASDIVITKAGWGTIGECVIGHSGMVLIERPSAIEDSFNINKIKERKLGISIKEEDLEFIDVLDLKQKMESSMDYEVLNSYKNSLEEIITNIL